MIEHWEHVDSEVQGSYKVFQVCRNRRRSPRSGKEYAFYVVESNDWVNIIPVTPDGKLVFIQQYRHGIEAVTLEIPGGMIDDGETPAEAARRELREETGYDTEHLVHLGGIAPNPAIQNNVCHTYLALDARPDGPQRLENTEDIEVVLVEPEDVPALILDGQVNHALVVTAFYLYDQYRRTDPPMP